MEYQLVVIIHRGEVRMRLRICGTLILLAALLSAGPAFGLDSSSEDSAELGVQIQQANFIAPSPERDNLVEEWVEIANLGQEEIALDGWTLGDEQNHIYTFPDGFFLPPGASVKIRSGKGQDGAADLYWNSSMPIWNNSGDIATLRDASGELVDRFPR